MFEFLRLRRGSDRARTSRRLAGFEQLESRMLLAVQVVLETVTADLSSPVVATHAGDGSARLFVAQQGGVIQFLRSGVLEPRPFLNLGRGGLERVLAGGERGLLGLAFHPDFATVNAGGEGKFYVYYSAPATLGGNHDSVVSEFQVSSDPDVADANSERELLRFRQPFSNHNGGDLHFGPDDGLLYISTGDGGSGGDPQNNAQNLSNLLGKILRIDVNRRDGPGGRYGIPNTNPFVDQPGARDEIFAYGLRNPYRFSFDDGPTAATADRLFAGDVGQSSFEEVDLITAGGNYGWRIREGAHPFNTTDPDPGNLIDPIAEYANDATTDSVIGGYVYRGTRFPSLQGRYLFGDLTGKMFVLDQNEGGFELSELLVEGGNPIGQNIIGFGQDEAGELYVLTFTSLLAIQTDAPALPLATLGVHPAPNLHVAPASTNVSVTFDQIVNAATATPETFAVHATQRGQLVGSAAVVSSTEAIVTLDPVSDFFPGELVQASVTSGIEGAAGQAALPRIWEFRTSVSNGSGLLVDSGQQMGNHRSREVALGDLDTDGDLDAFVINLGQANRVWWNTGGQFSDSGQVLGDHNSRGISLGDLDGDGDLDAFVTNRFQANRIWLNDGGRFTDSGQSLGDHDSYSVALGDLDGDGDLDAYVANLDQANRIYINVGSSTFVDSGQTLGDHASENVAVGDLDGDGDLDVFVGNSHQGNRVWLNQGEGAFVDGGLSLGDHDSCGLSLGDLDGDGDLDAFVSNSFEGNRIWLNNGRGVFVDSGQSLGDHDSWGNALGDLDADGDLDAFVANFNEGNRVWLNDAGRFSDSGQSLGNHLSYGVALGDLDGDGDLDAFVANRDQGNRVWFDPLGNAPRLSVTSLVPTSTGFIAEFSNDLDPALLNLYTTQTTEVGPADVILEGATSGPVSGSLVVASSQRSVTFVKTGSPLPADTYTVTLRSAADGFKDPAGNLLDGDGNGIGGDDYVRTFTIAPPAASTVTLALPDFARGAGQAVNLPADATTGAPLSISIAEGANVRAVDLRISYDPALLTITGATVGAEMPVGASVILNNNGPGLAILVFSSTTALPEGTHPLVDLQAFVPANSAGDNYGRGQVLDIHDVVVSDGMGNELPVTDDDAIHLASYFADVSGNGRINSSDASQVARFAALLGTGFAGSLLTDPLILGDISGNGRINAADASLLAQFAALIRVPEIPPIPSSVVVGGGEGLGSVFLAPPLDPSKKTASNLEGAEATVTSHAIQHDAYGTIDKVVTVRFQPPGGMEFEEVPLRLEEAIDQLFSALDLAPSD